MCGRERGWREVVGSFTTESAEETEREVAEEGIGSARQGTREEAEGFSKSGSASSGRSLGAAGRRARVERGAKGKALYAMADRAFPHFQVWRDGEGESKRNRRGGRYEGTVGEGTAGSFSEGSRLSGGMAVYRYVSCFSRRKYFQWARWAAVNN